MDLKHALKILRLSSCGSEAELKAAFYKLAHDSHPDKNPTPEAQDAFREAVLAYEYCVEHWSECLAQAGVTAEIVPPLSVEKILENSEQVFADLFGYSASGRILGFQEPYELRLSLRELLKPVRKTQIVMAYETCADCQGQGRNHGPKARLCRYCFGQGRITVDLPHRLSYTVCPKCTGRGREIEVRCQACDGFGRRSAWRRVQIELPQGVRPGQVVAVSARIAKSGKTVDLFLRIAFKSDGIFRIDNLNLICDYAIDFANADFWRRDYVLQTADGPRSFRVSSGSRPGDQVLLHGLGLYRGAGSTARGDLIVVLTPKLKFWQRWFRRIFS